MENDLIKVLNFKLKYITNNIDELNVLNDKIDDENVKLRNIQNAIENFKAEDHGFDIHKFSNISRETFNKILMELSDDVLVKFGTASCNYDGLIYLINGINSGISLTLTQEQTEAINLFIDELLKKEKDYQENIVSLNADKQKLEVQDLDVLYELENKYSMIIENIEDKKYVCEIDDIVSAILFSDVSKEKTFEILCFLLKYNSKIYLDNKKELEQKDNQHEMFKNSIDLTKPFEMSYDLEKDTSSDEQVIENDIINLKEIEEDREQDISNNEDKTDETSDVQPNIDLSFDNTMQVPEFDYLNMNLDSSEKDDNTDEQSLELPIAGLDEEEVDNQEEETEQEEFVNEYNPVLPNLDDTDENELDSLAKDEEISLETEEINEEISNEEVEDNDLELPVANEVEEEDNFELNIEDAELNDLFKEYRIDYQVLDEVTKNFLKKGSLISYKNILNTLDELKVLDYLKERQNILIQMMLYSNLEIIENIVNIIEKDLSVDEKDKDITVKYAFETIPTIFMNSENGNYSNFINNIELFKEYGIDLINLFDFSKEVYLADSELIENNYNIARQYDLTVNAYNTKYLLLLPNLSEKIDYFVEALYKDNSKEGRGETFDGIDLIKLYPNKLNVVASETIERLRYSSESGRKVFGSKEKSLAGEITNLKVDVINIPVEYTKQFFNNEFDIISRDEVETYIKLIKNAKDVEIDIDDVLSNLEPLRQELRYIIEGINVSRNKVIHNYNVLIKNNVSKEKALLFAICYNLVITKDEYEKVKNFVNSLGGN